MENAPEDLQKQQQQQQEKEKEKEKEEGNGCTGKKEMTAGTINLPGKQANAPFTEWKQVSLAVIGTPETSPPPDVNNSGDWVRPGHEGVTHLQSPKRQEEEHVEDEKESLVQKQKQKSEHADHSPSASRERGYHLIVTSDPHESSDEGLNHLGDANDSVNLLPRKQSKSNRNDSKPKGTLLDSDDPMPKVAAIHTKAQSAGQLAPTTSEGLVKPPLDILGVPSKLSPRHTDDAPETTLTPTPTSTRLEGGLKTGAASHNNMPKANFDNIRSLKKEDEAIEQMQFIRSLKINCMILIGFILSGMLFYGYLCTYEIHAQRHNPAIFGGFSLTDAFRWSIVTLSTIGYGDMAPVTTGGRVFAGFYMLFGISLLTRFVGMGFDRAQSDYEAKMRAIKLERKLASVDEITEFDEDGSGDIDKYEFLKTMLINLGDVEKSTIDRIMKRFDEIDKDGSGLIDTNDFREYVQNKNQELSERQVVPYEKNATFRKAAPQKEEVNV
ncbi:VIC family transporter: calcium-activated outward-rectifying potassium ion channel [Reticulomyxa filosa]|uniref:VIC family transporter: calcium-activated outward-rectifying potassium ion channel n=1 Tax=Reticulomyxa filosa TaxID=46433 RepID=X6NDW2_RETFI|nr:VIC family transporter: calcium-activated outward-rectifying potassium ion channel [Reticulomyxa filosa]|eukprot:ETO24181.1 VIC family transporter: calcium-activated outward-rectifying potassium ion channel [Reticulomyxa filosa]